MVICHGYPSGSRGASTSAATFPQLADRIATELGFVALTFCFRGAGESEGDFSLRGWLHDVGAAVAHVHEQSVSAVWVAGFGTGGGLALCAAASAPAPAPIAGVAALASPADFEDWANQPRRLLDHSRDIGLIRDPSFPRSVEAWSRELREIRPVGCVPALRDRQLLIVHGTEDDVVPDFDGRVLSDAHGHADMRLIAGAGHRLRHDPRAVAVLLGWLDRQHHRRPEGAVAGWA